MEFSVFRGATKPTMLFGVPLMALGALIFPAAILLLWLGKFFGWIGGVSVLIVVFAAVPIMREMTKRDDQYLRMFGLNLQETLRSNPNRLGSVRVIPAKVLKSRKFVRL